MTVIRVILIGLALGLTSCASTSWQDSHKMQELDYVGAQLSVATGVPVNITPIYADGGQRGSIPVMYVNGRMVAVAVVGDAVYGFDVYIPMRGDTWYSASFLEQAEKYVQTLAYGLRPAFKRTVVGSTRAPRLPIPARVYMSSVTASLPAGGSAVIVYVSSMDDMSYYASYGGPKYPTVNEQWVAKTVEILALK